MFRVLLLALTFVAARGSVDLTRKEGSSGSAVVEATIDVIERACIFSDDKMFLRRMAYVETQDGADAKTYRSGYHGGIWQIDKTLFDRIRRIYTYNSRHPQIIRLRKYLISRLQMDPLKIQWEDLRKPLYSAVAARTHLYFSVNIPRDVRSQALVWRRSFSRMQHAGLFEKAVNDLEKGCSSTAHVDMLFVLDASGSIGSTNFYSVKRFVKNVIGAFQVGPTKTRVGVIKFSSSVTTEFDLDDPRVKDNKSALKMIDRIRYTAGGTNTRLALEAITKCLEADGCALRPQVAGVPRVVIVLTDGVSASPSSTVLAAKRAHQEDITVFAIGVGRSLNMNELTAIASSPSCQHLFLLSSFREIDSLKAAIQKKTCEAPMVMPPPTGGKPIEKPVPPKSTQYCKLKVPKGGLTVKIEGQTGSGVSFYTSRLAFPSAAMFQTVVKSSTHTRVAVYIPFSGNGTQVQVYCSIVNEEERPSQIAIDILPGDQDWCDSSPCENNGKCVDEGKSGYSCDCPTGYSGKNCEIEPDPCDPNPCKNSANCVGTGVTTYTCECARGFSGTHCETHKADPVITTECSLTKKATDYQGKKSTTRSGKTCQRWDAQTPHQHSFINSATYADDTISAAENYCRNPDPNEGGGTWCYTTDPKTRWEWCDVPVCECTMAKDGRTYGGFESTTVSGKACQRWDRQYPHRHHYTNPRTYADGSLSAAHNYCRNPDPQHGDGTWCYTTDPKTRWEPCDLPVCAKAGFDCQENNPCTQQNIDSGAFYHPHADKTKFVECDEWRSCFVMPCPPTMVWSDLAYTCIREGDPICTMGDNCHHGKCVKNACTCDSGYTGIDCNEVPVEPAKKPEDSGQTQTTSGFNCKDNNPCTQENWDKGDLYHPGSTANKYVQCAAVGVCYEMSCPATLVWNDASATCNFP